MRLRPAIAALGPVALSVVLLLGCDDAHELVQPTPPPAIPPPGTPPPGGQAGPAYSIHGAVADTAFRPLGGARVEVTSGPRAGTVVMTDDGGHYSLSGTFTGDTTLMASKDGYQSQTYTVLSERFRPGADAIEAWAAFYLELPGPAANMTGVYSVTIAADSACSTLPDDARVRTYSATAAPGNRPGLFVVSLSDALFFRYTAAGCSNPACSWLLNRISIGIAGDFAGFWLTIVEKLGGTSHLLIEGGGYGSIDQAGISTSFEGSIVPCPTEPTLIDQGTWACHAATDWCTSRNHRLTLTRR